MKGNLTVGMLKEILADLPPLAEVCVGRSPVNDVRLERGATVRLMLRYVDPNIKRDNVTIRPPTGFVGIKTIG